MALTAAHVAQQLLLKPEDYPKELHEDLLRCIQEKMASAGIVDTFNHRWKEAALAWNAANNAEEANNNYILRCLHAQNGDD